MDVDGSYKDIAEAVASLLTKAGIDTKVAVGESAILSKKWRTDGQAQVGRHVLHLLGQRLARSAGHLHADPPHRRARQLGRLLEPGVDKLLDDAAVEVDRAKREAMYQKAEAIGEQPTCRMSISGCRRTSMVSPSA